MKKIDVKAFWIIMSGLVATVVYRIVDLFLSKNREFPRLSERMDAEKLERLATALFRFDFIFTLIFALICLSFVFRLIKNRKQEQGQKYISFLFAVNIIVVALNILSLLLGNIIALISIAVNVAIIIGCSIQKNYET